MQDILGRKIEYMRISITDRCNLRCRYCMPEGTQLLPMGELLTYEEILAVCREAAALGITRFKITGGEPLVRRGAAGLIRQMKALPGVEQVTLTTNGILLKENIRQLADAGIDGINISLDSLDRENYKNITGFDMLSQVLEGIDAALEANCKVKINSVLQKGVNDHEWRQLTELARDRKMDVRFIELMPIGYGDAAKGISGEKLEARIREAYPGVEEDLSPHGNGPARYIRIPGFAGSIGFISAVHGPFCGTCNRIRMTSTGDVKPCLCYDDHFSVKDAVREGDMPEVRRLLEQAILAKPKSHCFNEEKEITEKKKMIQIGG